MSAPKAKPANGGWIATCMVCGWERWNPTRTHVERASVTHHATHVTKDDA